MQKAATPGLGRAEGLVGDLLPRLVTPTGVKGWQKGPPVYIYIYGCSPPLLIPLTLEDIEGVRGWCVLFFPSYALEVFDEMPDTPF